MRVTIYLSVVAAGLVSVAAMAWASASPAAADEGRDALPPPNILWITAEDMSATLGAYGDDYATTPNLDRLAEQSVRYTRAFANSPVCSTARSTLITGNYAPSLGTHQMRSAFELPEWMRGFPARLRQAGYYTTNNVKTDYNTGSEPEIIAASWNESSETAHWRDRGEGPFFSVFNLMTSHQSRTMVWPYERFEQEVQSRLSADQIHDPDQAPLPPYYPDTPLVRREVARYYDCVTAMDQEVGEILAQLEEAGLAENTIVFFFSDHGAGMPRHKRASLDTGLHVPLMVRFPEKYAHLAPAEAGEGGGAGGAVDRMVSFVDFAPTVLSLAGLEAPAAMQGRAFAGEHEAEPRELVYHYRDRIDEARDLARGVRDEQYLYVRNYMPHLGYHQPTWWPDQGEIRAEFDRLADAEQVTEAQWHYVAPTRPVEELYDYQADPLNLQNLADSAEHADVLERMRRLHRQQIREHRDLGFVPESEQWRIFEGTTPWEGTIGGRVDLEPLFDAAADVGVSDESTLLANLASDDPGVRYWGAIGLAVAEEISGEGRAALRRALADVSSPVRIEAANALATHGQMDGALQTLAGEFRVSSAEPAYLDVLLHATRTVELLGEDGRPLLPLMRAALERAYAIRPADTEGVIIGEPDLAWFIQMSGEAFLERLGE